MIDPGSDPDSTPVCRVSPRARGLMSSCHMRGCPAFGEPPGRRGRRQRVSENGFPAVHPLSCRIPSVSDRTEQMGMILTQALGRLNQKKLTRGHMRTPGKALLGLLPAS